VKAVRLVLRFDRDALHPMHAHVCESPAVDREAILQGHSPDAEGTLLLYVEGDREAYERHVAALPHVDSVDVSPGSDDGFYVFVREQLDTEEPLVEALQRERLIVVPPVEFRPDRTMRLSLVGHAGDIQAALDDLPAGATPDVRAVGDYSLAVGDTLTDRQREAVAVAWNAGYYDVPRDAGIEAVAAELDCAVSTASALLRRAESRLVAGELDESW
jgi:hypothetical protein